MRQLLFSPAAQNDLTDIYDYTLETWGIEQAETYVRYLHKTCQDIASGNIKGLNVDYVRQGYFKKSIGSHFIFYRKPIPRIVEIVRILHQRMNIELHL